MSGKTTKKTPGPRAGSRLAAEFLAEGYAEIEARARKSRKVTLKSYQRGLVSMSLVFRLILRELAAQQQLLFEALAKGRRSEATKKHGAEVLRFVDLLLYLYVAPAVAELAAIGRFKPGQFQARSNRGKEVLVEVLGRDHRLVKELLGEIKPAPRATGAKGKPSRKTRPASSGKKGT